MSHIATRLLADRFADPDEGIGAVVAGMSGILYPGDTLPDFSITIYDDTRDGWVMRGMAPMIDQGIDYPCIRLVTTGVDADSGVPQSGTTGLFVEGTVRIAAQLLLQHSDTLDATMLGMYLLRAMRGVVLRWDDPSHFASRQTCGLALYPATSVTQGKPDWPLGDNVVSPGALMITYPFMETVPLP